MRCCAACGTANQVDENFCGACGAALAQEADDPPRGMPHHAPPDPRAYTPRHLADKILTSRAALEGERKQVTVLFADIHGSLALQEDLDPEDWHRVMDCCFAILTAGVHRFEGTVNQYTGDGIMALFGAPIAHEDHAQRGCYAALHLQTELLRYAEELRRTRGFGFAIRLGLNSGEVVVGKIGDDLRMDYTAQGHVVGLAARMEQLAAPDRVYLTAHTAALVAGYFRLRDLGLFTVKGVREPLRIHELEGVGTLRTRLDVSRARGFSRFVGRADEMAALATALTRAAAGTAQVVGVVAEAGVGKSRLVHEFAQHCRTQGVAIHTAHGVAHGKLIPFLPVLELLRDYFGLTAQDGDAVARTKVAGTLVLLDPALSDGLALLFDFLGVPDPAQPAAHTESEVRQRALLAVLKRLVHAATQRAPEVILIEDLHWIDGASETFLENLVAALPGSRALLLVNFRPEYHANWMQKSFYQQIALAPLGAAASAELLENLLGRDPSLAGLVELLHARTGGNPFFIEEAVQALVGSGVLDGTRGAYRLTQPVREVAIPATVQALLAARIDRLAPPEKAVLETAAVIGKEFSATVLQRVAALPDSQVTQALHTLMTVELVYARALYPEAEYAFKHPLTQEVAYRMQLADRRARVHAAVAQALGELSAGKGDEHAALLAHHWEAAGERLEAARCSRRAAEWVSMSNFPEALRHWRKVRALVEGLSESAEARELAGSASANIFGLQVRLGMAGEEPTALLAELQTLANEHQEPRLRAILLAAPAAANAMAGQADEALEPLREATRIADSTADPGLQLALRAVLVLAHFMSGRLRDGLAITDEALAGASSEDPRLGTEIFGFVPVVMLRLFRALMVREMGRLDEAARELRRTEELAEAQGQLEVLSMVHQSYVDLARLTGDPRPAMAHARRAVEAAEALGSAFSRGQAYAALGGAHALNHDWDAAASAYEQSLSIIRESGTGRTDEPFKVLGLAECYLHQGKADAARTTAEEAVTLARRYHARVSECYALLTRARVLLGTTGADAAAEIAQSLEQALGLVTETGGAGAEPFIHLERAELARLTGDGATYAVQLDTAYRLLVQMGATAHAERVRALRAAARQL
jgi:class 3 adenylate cyclase/tetratricopeptide (TPR) repeat protein